MVRRGFDAWNRLDLDAFMDTFDAEAVVITDPSWMEPGPFQGREEIRRWYEGLRESWEERDNVVVAEVFEVGNKVVGRINWEVRGRSSGIDTNLDSTCVNTIAEGRIVRQQWYFDHAEALEAVGSSS